MPKLMVLLAAAVAVPSPSIAASTGINPRGVKRAWTPDQRGNTHADGDRDDGTCVLGLFYDAPDGVGTVGGSSTASSHIDPLNLDALSETRDHPC